MALNKRQSQRHGGVEQHAFSRTKEILRIRLYVLRFRHYPYNSHSFRMGLEPGKILFWILRVYSPKHQPIEPEVGPISKGI